MIALSFLYLSMMLCRAGQCTLAYELPKLVPTLCAMHGELCVHSLAPTHKAGQEPQACSTSLHRRVAKQRPVTHFPGASTVYELQKRATAVGAKRGDLV